MDILNFFKSTLFNSNLWFFVSKFTEFDSKKLLKIYRKALHTTEKFEKDKGKDKNLNKDKVKEKLKEDKKLQKNVRLYQIIYNILILLGNILYKIIYF